MNKEIDTKKVNQLLRISSKILKKMYILIFIIAIYISILILNKLNVMLFITTFLRILSPLFIGVVIAWLLRPIIKYLSNNGIPEDEVEEFINLHFCYKKCGGNHLGDAKFNYCMEHLPVIPAVVKFDEMKSHTNQNIKKDEFHQK